MYVAKHEHMNLRATHVSVAAIAVALLACADSPESDSSIATRFARAATKAVVDAILEVDGAAEENLRQPTMSEPLQVAASRPNSILEQVSEPSDDSTAATRGHVVIATAVPDVRKICTGSAAALRRAAARDWNPTVVQCPVSRTRTGNLSRI